MTSRTDRAAFEVAIDLARKDPLQRKRIDAKFAAGVDFVNIGKAAAYHCQIESLGLLPWQSPPCYADMRALNEPYGDPSGRRESAELALRMQRQDVSRWNADPVAACVEAEQRKAG
ncbi:hypothetical protein AB7008_23630 [Bradyrhizobium sp. 521_C7_N1_3]|uniref:hypothetical protein n=1 Tax=Bradyrhizobium sp. 521_C7_N1_3 TaxID=3240368 RepID=UPI003F8AEF8E